MTLRTVLPRLLLGLAILAATLSLAPYPYQLDSTVIEGAIRNVGVGGPMVHVALFAFGTNLFVPGALFGLAGGVLFEPVWGTILNLAGDGGRHRSVPGRTLFGGGLGPAESRSEAGAAHQGSGGGGLRFVAFVRLVPILPLNLLNYALGVTRIRLVDYVLASFACMLPGTLAYTYLGYAGPGSPVGRGVADTESPCCSAPIGSGGISAAPSPNVACRQTT